MSTEPKRPVTRIALLSDVHANLPALEAVLADIDKQSDLSAVYHIGDLVGYAPWPDEVVGLLRNRGITGVAGNYDSTTATAYKHCGCKYENPRQAELADSGMCRVATSHACGEAVADARSPRQQVYPDLVPG